MTGSEYDPAFGRQPAPESDDLEGVRETFRAAAAPFLRSPWSWALWALLLPAAALSTPAALAAGGASGALLLWSGAILAGGCVEIVLARRGGGRATRSTLAAWSLRTQGNLSVVAVGLSVALIVAAPGAVALLPGLWLLLLGHSFYVLGGLAFRPLRTCGLIYQLGGLVALWPGAVGLWTFAAATAAGNLWVAWRIWQGRKG